MSSKTSPLKQRYAQTAVYFLIVAGFGVVMSAIGPVLPALAGQTQTSLREIGLLFTSRALGVLFGALLGGRIFDRLPGHPLLAGCMVLMAATFAVVPMISNFGLLLLVGLVMGFAAGLLLAGSNTLLVWVHADNVGPWMNGLSFFNGMGGFVAPIIITGFLTMTGQMQGAFWAIALLVAAAGAGMFFVPSPAIRKTADVPGAEGSGRFGLVILFALVFLLYGGAEISFSSWLYTFVVKLHSNATTTAAMLTSAFWAAMAVGRLLAIPVSTRLRPRAILIIDFSGAMASLIVLLTLAESLTALWVGTIGFGFFMASFFPVWLVFIDNRIKVDGKINGIFIAASAAGGMFFPWLAGLMFDTIGPLATMAMILVTLLIAACIFGVMTRIQPAQADLAAEPPS
ncbi:MAG: MFS transporter [Anaerolineaceae bacterium]|nr:MFS transporter [Anaerolineaceae bacterium]